MTSFGRTAIATVKVIDASALVAMIFDEPGALDVARQLEGARLIAPDLLDIEVINVCILKLRRKLVTQAQVNAALGLGTAMQIEISPVLPDQVLELAMKTGLKAYDTCYLWLARTRGAELVTLDKQLQAAFLKPSL